MPAELIRLGSEWNRTCAATDPIRKPPHLVMSLDQFGHSESAISEPGKVTLGFITSLAGLDGRIVCLGFKNTLATVFDEEG